MTAKIATAEYEIEPLGSRHERGSFLCGVAALDNYIQRQARQDMERKLAAVFILTRDSKTIAGFYTLSAQSLLAVELPGAEARGMPRFPLPATLLGRMAVSQTLRGMGLGELLLMHALERAWMGSQQVASWAVLVDAKEGVRDFYVKYNFISVPSNPDRLFLPMRTIERLFTS